MSPLSLSGLASGIDTESIVKQLMAVEGQAKTRLQLADTRAVARQTGLRDLASKLGALRDAANALKSTTTWADVQQLVSSDPARVAVRAQGTAAPGARVIEVTALAVTAQHAFNYTSSAAPQTLAIGAFSLAVDPASTVATVAAAINDRADAPVSAVVAGGKLVLTSRTGGAGGDFTVGASPLVTEDAVYARAGSNAAYLLDGVPKTASSNVITDAILGAEITLKATTTAPISLTVSDPAPDTESVKAKVGHDLGSLPSHVVLAPWMVRRGRRTEVRAMRTARSLCLLAASSGALALAIAAPAAATPGNGCDVGGSPLGQFISFLAQNVGHSGSFNPGNDHGPIPGAGPFVPTHETSDCNPTDNPSPPIR